MSIRLRLGRKAAPLTIVSTLLVALTAATAAVAYAATTETIDINPGNVPYTAAGFGDHSCDQVPATVGEHEDGWVFVLPDNDWTFVSLTATFTDLNGGSQSLSGTLAGSPSGEATAKMYIITPAGWTLTGATATVSTDDDPPGETPKTFNLTHTCPGTPSEPEPEPSSPASTTDVPTTDTPTTDTPSSDTPSSDAPSSDTPSSDDTSSDAATTGAAGGNGSDTKPTGGSMPITGLSLTLPLLLGLVLVVAGAAAVYLARRRRILAAWNEPTD